MPSLSIKPPQSISESQSSPPVQLSPFAPANDAATSQATYAHDGETSPVAPAYSPITPKAQPAIPNYPLPPLPGPDPVLSPAVEEQPAQHDGSVAPTAHYIPEPPPQPFSSEDSTDAIALRAAISSLQFQKKKAQDDLKALEKVKQQALADPERFKGELAAGRLKEQRMTVGDLRAILDHEDSDSDDDEAMLDMSRVHATEASDSELGHKMAEVPDSQPSRPGTSSASKSISRTSNLAPFDPIPGPQNVVRMPYINWDKYHIQGEALDRMHEQQRRWPGTFDYGQERGREHVVAAPYSAWLDSVNGQSRSDADQRKDSLATTPTISEHPMETRRSFKNP